MDNSEITAYERLSGLLRACGRRVYFSSCAGRTQIRVLRLLLRQGAMSQKDVQDRLEIQPGSVSELMGKLEMKGLIERVRDTDDRRKVLLSLTARGEAAAQEAEKRSETKIDYGALDEGEQAQLCRLLEKLVNSWDEEALAEGCVREEK